MRLFLRSIPVLGGLVILGSLGSAVWASHRGQPPAALRGTRTPVIVELFSSEGCSSCPPADAWLSSLDRSQSVDGVTVLALEEHVDYWDRLGWRDPFGQGAFGERQRGYARVLPDRRVFTPEIVVDGHALVEGDDSDDAARELRASADDPRAKVTVTRHGDRVTVDASDIPSPGDDVSEIWLAVTESGLASDVATGENAGRRLVHAPIVRVLKKLGAAPSSTFHGETDAAVDPAWSPRAVRFVAFVQRARSRRIVGANVL
jgi:hypothetical protein